MTEKITFLTGTIVDDDTLFTLGELCRLCGINAELLHDMIDEGLICPRDRSPLKWKFTVVEIRRVQTAIRLQRDLRVNLPGCALALDLLEELEELRRIARSR
ncbi:MAG: MerR family transcriptional regulator [Desulfobulbaceae bacterium]|nr:MerR family transcriptional regulator [Desulfobulbaceae bacterium]